MSKPLKGFITYSHEDMEAKDELRKRLAVMEQQDQLVTWDDGQFTPGDKALQEDILKKVADSDLLLYLVSAASLASKNCNKELAEAIKQEMQVIPIILEHCDWLKHQLNDFQAFPDRGIPITEWEDKSEGWQNVREGIRKVVERMQIQADPSSKISEKELHSELAFQHGNILMMLGQLDMAIKAYSDAIDHKPCNANAYNNRGVAYTEKGKFDNAIEDYNITIQLRPDDANINYNKRIVYTNKGDYGLAIQEVRKMIELDLEFSRIYHNRAAAYSKKGEVELAIKDYTKAIELYPDAPNTYYDRGNTYYEKGDYDRAIEDYTEAIELNPNLYGAYINRGNVYISKNDYDRAIRDHTKAIELNPNSANAYNNRGVAYGEKDDAARAIENYTKAIELNPNHDIAYYNRGIVWLHLQKWNKAKVDLTTAKGLGMDIIAAFHNSYRDVETFERRANFRLPENLALLLTQRRRDRYPKTQKLLDADGNPLESPNVVNLLSQLRNAGMPLGEYVESKPSFGINTAPTEAFVVDKATRDKLIATDPSSADILKPFLHGQDIRRWHVDTPQQWLIFTHRGIAINDYPAILKHLEKYQETLSKRKGKQRWYELPVSLGDTDRFAQPKLVCPDTYNHQTFAVDTAGYYYGKTAYLIPTEEMWLCGLLNSRTVEWFYSQVSNQLTIDPLRARSGYIQQIPIPDITPVHKALIAKIVDYLIYLQQQPEINSKDLKYARDRIMLGYFERVIDGLVYEAYLPAELHKSDKVFLQPLLDEGLPSIEEIQNDKMSAFRDIFEVLYDRMHPIRRNLFFLDSVKLVRVIQGKL
ncbi:MAG: tetratricopeptide repeat protein [Candidatus Poribacteria bacterium]|nr:tetratricopeptide repeat protein [Candidatus Poribacteria bacterium]